MSCGIYMLTNTRNGKSYIGQARDIARRMRAHKAAKGDEVLARAVKKHGWEAFAVTILEICPREDLNAAEARWIAERGTTVPGGYNLTSGGGQGVEYSAESKKKMSASAKRALSNPEARAKLSAAVKLSHANQDVRAKMSAAARTMSQEARARIQAAHAAAMSTPEARANISASARRRGISAETRAKMNKALVRDAATGRFK